MGLQEHQKPKSERGGLLVSRGYGRQIIRDVICHVSSGLNGMEGG